jgi:hypothetical protein
MRLYARKRSSASDTNEEIKANVINESTPTSLLARFIHSVNQQHAELHFTLVKKRLKYQKSSMENHDLWLFAHFVQFKDMKHAP